MKMKVVYLCRECGFKSSKWLGRCTSCGTWESFIEETVSDGKNRRISSSAPAGKTYRLDEIDQEAEFRVGTGSPELDRVLGGGIIPGSLILIGGDPGIGKSTVTLQLCHRLATLSPLYITGEESLQQIKYRAGRLGFNDREITVMPETCLETMEPAIRSGEYGIIVIDSIQSVYTEKVEATPGSISQIRETTAVLMQIAKKLNKTIIIIGHVTKDGMIAGPKLLEHMVDTVLQFEGDKTGSFRILRSLKNRYGSTNELGIFEMTEKGLEEVDNPSQVFLNAYSAGDTGLSIVSSMEGSRPLLLEVQALVTPTAFSVPQRTVQGIDLRRLQIILAVLEKRLGIKFFRHDVFVNIAGGIYLNDPSVDLGIAAALVGSLNDTASENKSLIVGEIGLTGEIRPVSNIEQRLNEAEKLGFGRAVIPARNFEKLSRSYAMKIEPVERISLALPLILGKK